MRKGRKGICLLAVTALVFFVCGCTQGGENRKSYVAVITKSTSSAFWKTVYAGADAAATEYNLSLTLTGPEKEEDYERQNQLVREAMDNGAEVIVFSAVDYNANSQVINEAAQRGIKIVVIDSDVNSDQVSCRIGTDNVEAGRQAAQAALHTDEEELYVGIVNYDVNSANGQQREQGFREIMEESPRVKEITTINVVSTTEDAREGTRELIKENPQINVIVTFNEWTSLGVGWAIRDLEVKDAIHVVAFDSNTVSVGMLETGEVDALIVQNPYAMGYLGVEAASILASGNNVQESDVDTSVKIVTRENMFEPECQKMLFFFD
ncbi:MAG TPA: substrate-binding domain-containing protein [Candidatus Acetatifactor stercoripullorum]|uniref:Substrate-binding domain-containing protein n=1 Tax=Candidatus Acetatifactor stercoripullorum TaxID=2838414 RepID=A0A9D1R6I6_9FIRM|nr:substrate-binding domain-containing protein [uncultured Acetatifactor sp.]HIW80966.1 substrate-binding domain-containing protein [Candidatus Acetatifactor stercoripullorum]